MEELWGITVVHGDRAFHRLLHNFESHLHVSVSDPTEVIAGRGVSTVMRHMDAAYNLALWLARNESDARDVVQEASLRAFRFFDRFDGRDARAWFLTIVRNAFYTWLRKNRPQELSEPLDPETCDVASEAPTPEVEVLRNLTRDQLWSAMGGLSVELRETLVLREYEELSYREIADLRTATTSFTGEKQAWSTG